jgi:hypothetical protein
MRVVCLAPDGTEEHHWENETTVLKRSWVEVDDVAYYFEDWDGEDAIFRRPESHRSEGNR